MASLRVLPSREASRVTRLRTRQETILQNSVDLSAANKKDTSEKKSTSIELSCPTFAVDCMSELYDLYQQGICCDVTLSTGDYQTSAHKVVLMASSEYFKSLFLGSPDDFIVLPSGVSGQSLQILIRFMYAGTLYLNSENIQSMLQTATKLMVNSAVNLCQKFLSENEHLFAVNEVSSLSSEKPENNFDDLTKVEIKEELCFSGDDDDDTMPCGLSEASEASSSKVIWSSDDDSPNAEILRARRQMESYMPLLMTYVPRSKKRVSRAKAFTRVKGEKRKKNSLEKKERKPRPLKKKVDVKEELGFSDDDTPNAESNKSLSLIDVTQIKTRVWRAKLVTRKTRKRRKPGEKEKKQRQLKKIDIKEELHFSDASNVAHSGASSSRESCFSDNDDASNVETMLSYHSDTSSSKELCSSDDDTRRAKKKKKLEGKPLGGMRMRRSLPRRSKNAASGVLQVLNNNALQNCHICGYSFETYSGLLRHRKSRHNLSSESYTSRLVRNLWRRSVQKILSSPNLIFDPSGSVEVNLSEASMKWVCPFCHSQFSNRSKCKTHILKLHPPKLKTLNLHRTNRHPRWSIPERVSSLGILKCPSCRRPFVHESSLQTHCAAHHRRIIDGDFGEGLRGKRKSKFTWRCQQNECRAVCRSAAQVKKHMATEHPTVRFSCPDCKFTCQVEEDFLRHREQKHGKMMMCHVCGKACYKLYMLRQHLYVHHKIKDPKLKLFQCSQEGCMYECSNKKRLEDHLKRHLLTKSLACDVCSKRFKHEIGLERHKRAIHEGIRPYICDQCGMGFGIEHELKNHIARHSNNKPHACDQCPYRTYDKINLQSHLFSQHNIETNRKIVIYRCEQCPFTSNRKGRYDDHMKKHQNIKDISCPECGKLFHSKRNLYGHTVKVHRPKNLHCPLCNFCTAIRSKFKEHTQNKHNRSPSEVMGSPMFSAAKRSSEVMGSPMLAAAKRSPEVMGSPMLAAAKRSPEVMGSPMLAAAKRSPEVMGSPMLAAAKQSSEVMGSPVLASARQSPEVLGSPMLASVKQSPEVMGSPMLASAKQSSEVMGSYR